ncbi:NAD(P)/FAD-dependent oxidoreductase [Terribacillus saccharophilus]|uniref:NAD(P)/FAD-dependent oxidoreductase n=1 Tax=Terribacillus saccharophilus TaxID=361277 RepID=UPI002DC2F5BB|nr:NAD(P)-binding domain-containing protein [Terribacillus saccharophilus]
MEPYYDVIIVGGGASGIGIGSILQEMGCEHFVILEKGEIGASFRNWPQEMRFITPSFPAQGFGQTDLNAIAPKTSPAYTLDEEHPTGVDYAQYLELIADHLELPVEQNTTVHSVVKNSDGFVVSTSKGDISSRFLIWAAGEYQYPNRKPFPGAELALHSSEVKSWTDIIESEHLIIGGYESGMDAAYQLCSRGAKIKVLAKTNTWEFDHSDPSVSLTPYTYGRIRKLEDPEKLELIGNTEAVHMYQEDGKYAVKTADNKVYYSDTKPILATGFTGSTSLLGDLVTRGDHGKVLLTEDDEVVKTPGLFLAGPEVRHDSHVFCYIYKFRQRYAVVAKAIADNLQLDQSILEQYKQENFILDDLSMCGERCQC